MEMMTKIRKRVNGLETQTLKSLLISNQRKYLLVDTLQVDTLLATRTLSILWQGTLIQEQVEQVYHHNILLQLVILKEHTLLLRMGTSLILDILINHRLMAILSQAITLLTDNIPTTHICSPRFLESNLDNTQDNPLLMSNK